MNAAHALKSARAVGIRVRIDGNHLDSRHPHSLRRQCSISWRITKPTF